MNPRGLTPALALLSLFLFPPEGAKVFRGKTQEALNLLGACYLLLPVLEGGGIESQVSPASLGATALHGPVGN